MYAVFRWLCGKEIVFLCGSADIIAATGQQSQQKKTYQVVTLSCLSFLAISCDLFRGEVANYAAAIH